MTGDPDQMRDYEAAIIDLDDERLIAELEATAATRGDGCSLEFVSFGLIRREPS